MVFFVLPPGCMFHSRLSGDTDIPEATNDRYLSCAEQMITIFLSDKGELGIGSDPVDDPSKLSLFISDKLDEMKSEPRIYLRADKGVEFEKIQFVLNAAKNAGVKEVMLITVRFERALDYIGKQRLKVI
jgi:biopolymer transport protein ExbD